MTRIIMHGCNGAMGRTITGLAGDMEDVEGERGIPGIFLPGCLHGGGGCGH